jgi:MFS family permease
LSDWAWNAEKLSLWRSRQTIVAAGFVVFAIVYGVFAGTRSKPLVWSTMAFYGLYYALTNPVLRALVADTAPPRRRGRAFGIYYFVTSIAALAASILTGQLWKYYGPQVPFFISSLLALLAALLLMVAAHGRRDWTLPERSA